MCHKQRYLLPYRPRLRAARLYNKQMFVKGDRRRGNIYSIYRRNNRLAYSIACRGWLAGNSTVWGAILDPITAKARGRERFGIKVRRGHDRQGITNGMTIYKQRSRRSVRHVQAYAPVRCSPLRVVRRSVLDGVIVGALSVADGGRWDLFQ